LDLKGIQETCSSTYARNHTMIIPTSSDANWIYNNCLQGKIDSMPHCG
jgi:hypothetical protein